MQCWKVICSKLEGAFLLSHLFSRYISPEVQGFWNFPWREVLFWNKRGLDELQFFSLPQSHEKRSILKGQQNWPKKKSAHTQKIRLKLHFLVATSTETFAPHAEMGCWEWNWMVDPEGSGKVTLQPIMVMMRLHWKWTLANNQGDHCHQGRAWDLKSSGIEAHEVTCSWACGWTSRYQDDADLHSRTG